MGKILCFDPYSDNIILNSQKHTLCRWVTKVKEAHFHERLSSWLQGPAGFWTKSDFCQKGQWVILFSSRSSPVTRSLSHVVIKPKHTLCFTPSESKRPESCCKTHQRRCDGKPPKPLISADVFCFSLPPLGRDSLKSPSVASQVLPSPPHTRHRSSLASDPRMLSQPTCFWEEKTRNVLIENWKLDQRVRLNEAHETTSRQTNPHTQLHWY